MKKKRHQKSEQGLPEQQSTVDYVVGQVSGSLFQDSAGSGSLSALFSAAPPPAPLVFVPAPKPVQKSIEVKQQKETPKLKGPTGQTPRKPPKEKTQADQKLENRESALLNADEEEQGKKTPKKTKRKAADAGEDGGGEDEAERYKMKRLKTKAIMAEEAIKRKRTVFVGNLPVSCTKKTLRVLFRDKGTIESIRFRSVVREDPAMSRKLAAIQRKVHPKKQSVNAYVVFKDEEGVAKALERNGVEIEKDFHIRVDRVTGDSSHDHKRSIFVGNLSFEINELAFRRHFEECGEVEAVRLVRDQNSGMGKGFGYVLFESADSVQLALKLDGSSLEGRSVRVKRSMKKEKVKTKTGPGKGPVRKTGKGPSKSPSKGPSRATTGPGGRRRETGPSRGGFQGRRGPVAQGNFTGNQHKSTSFKGEMVDPNKKPKKKLKKKPRKTVHF
ncbi:RNA-binding protein 34 [Diretmus argenteus]